MNQFASVELIGHVQHIGYLTEIEMLGQKFGHVKLLNSQINRALEEAERQ